MSKEIINTILKERIFDRKNKKRISFGLSREDFSNLPYQN